jgi:hypothetical protein
VLGFSVMKKEIDKASGVTNWTLHDLRRTARTLLSGCVGVSVDVVELCIGHTKKGVRGVYDQHDYISEMRMAFEKLAARVEMVVNPPADNVTQSRSAAIPTSTTRSSSNRRGGAGRGRNPSRPPTNRG